MRSAYYLLSVIPSFFRRPKGEPVSRNRSAYRRHEYGVLILKCHFVGPFLVISSENAQEDVYFLVINMFSLLVP